MPKITEEPLTVTQVRLFSADLAKLRQLYGSTIGVNQAIRVIVRSALKQIEAKAAEEIDELGPWD